MKGKKEAQFALIALLIVSQVYLGLLTFVAAADEEHSYIIFHDDFEDGEAEDWHIDIPPEAPLGSMWEIERDDDDYVLSEEGGVWASYDFAWTDYTFEVEAKLLTTEAFQVSFRSSGLAGRYIVAYYLGGSALTLRKEGAGVHFGDPRTFNDLKVTEVSFNPNMWYSIKMVCIGNHLEVYVDDALKISYTDNDDPILSGGIVLEGCNSHVHFDDVKVSTTHSLYVIDLTKKVEIEINKARLVGADTVGAEEKLVEAQDAFDNGNLSGAESLAKEAFDLAQNAQPLPTEPEPTEPEPTEPGSTTPEPTEPEPTEPEATEPLSGITLSSEWIAIILSICGLAAGAGTWIFRTQSARKRNKILFNKLMEDIDDVYSRFRMNKLRCESELYKYKNQVLEDFKQGLIDEEKYNILDKRIINYLKEIKEKIAKDRN